MGVRGITPFLHRVCPHVFRSLPDRLRSLRGTTVVIDGTLVTQRLHFAPMPHPHRHIIGWHRILTELRDSDVRAICVFDGKHRIAAKAREVERRRQARRIDALRGSIERVRLHRLHRLMRLLPYYRSLPCTDRQRINAALCGIKSAHATAAPHASPPSQSPSFLPHHVVPLHDLQDVLGSVAASTSASRSEPHYMQPSIHLDDPTGAITSDEFGSCDPFHHDHDIFRTLPLVHWNAAVQATHPSPDGIESFQSELSALYCEYSQSITQLTSMPASPEGTETLERQDSHDALDAQIEYAMSKQQYQMALEEGHIWNLLSVPLSDAPPPETESALMALAERSTVVSQSYQRRSNVPKSHIYDECKELLRAMGVPYIESTGPFEAEALACSLVTHGHADYVVTEDTDVLVYEIPMLRGITARESPVVVVQGDAIRTTLALDRARYVDFALLLGTDFVQRIKHVGPSRALQFIREHGSIERVVEQESKYPPRVPVAEYLAQVGIARLVFQNLPPPPDVGHLRPMPEDPSTVSDIIARYGLHRMLPGTWDTTSALEGNYFADDPSVW